MPQARSHEEAVTQAVRAHNQHFGTENSTRITEDSHSSSHVYELTKPTPRDITTPLKYTVKFDVLLPDISQDEILALREARSSTNSITFEVYLPEDFPSDRKRPVECTDRGCPVYPNFHYQGLYLDSGYFSGIIDDDFGLSDPSYQLRQANARLKADCGDRDDLGHVQSFIKNHYCGENH